MVSKWIPADIAKRVEELISTLNMPSHWGDGDRRVCMNAAEALGEIGNGPAIQGLIDGLSLGWPEGDAVIKALVKLGKPAVQPLIAVLKDENEDDNVRRCAVAILGKIGDKLVVPHLKKLIEKGKEKSIQVESAHALVTIEDNQSALQFLVEVLNDENEYVRSSAAEALGEIGDKRAVEPLVKALKDGHYSIHEAAAYALGEIGDRRAVEPLVKALKDGHYSVREAAAYALGKIGDKRAVEPLIEALRDNRSRVSAYAAKALGKIIDERAAKPLVNALKNAVKNEDWDLCTNAEEALGKIGEPAVAPLINTLKKGRNKDVRCFAAEALGKIGKLAVEPLIEALNDERMDVRQNAANALGKTKDLRAVEPLASLLKDKNQSVRMTVTWALGEIGDKRAVGPLISALEDENCHVRKNAAEALEELCLEAGSDEERVYYFLITNGRGKDFVSLGSAAIPHLVKALEYRDWNFRRSAASGLRRIGDRTAIQPLIETLKDSNKHVRFSAARALKEITGKDFSEDYEKWKAWYRDPLTRKMMEN